MSRILNPTKPSPRPTAYPSPTTHGCMLHFDMQDRGSRVIDHSGYGHHGIIDGPILVPGTAGYRMEFDGVDDWVVVPAESDLEPSDITVLMTAEFRTLADGNVYVSATNSSAQGQVWYMCVRQQANPGPHRVAWIVWARDAWGEMGFITYGATIEVGVRYRIGCVFRSIRPTVEWEEDGQHYRAIYVNGELSAANTQYAGQIAYRKTPILLGRAAGGWSAMDGWIEDVQVFNRALTASEFREDARMHVPDASR